MKALEEIDFFSREVLADPYEFLARARAEQPIVKVRQLTHGRDQYLVTTYPLAQAVLTDPARFSSNYLVMLTDGGRVAPEVAAIRAQGFEEVNTLLTSDDPDHRRMRSLVATCFVPKRLKRMSELLDAAVDELIDAFPQDECDFGQAFAAALPARSLAKVMDFDPERVADLQGWSEAITRRFGQMASLEQSIADEYAILDAKRYIVELIERRRETPGEDVISDLVHARVDGEARLSELEILSTIFILMVGGTETTTSTLLFAMAHMLEHPALRAQMGDDKIVRGVIDEVLRFYTPVAAMWRLAREDVELAGVRIAKGSILMIRLDSANRDPAQFADPDRFDIGRPGNVRHLGFGYGPHSCVGFKLAQMELALALPKLARRLVQPRLIADRSNLTILPNTNARCISRLMVGYDGIAPGAIA